MFKPPRRSRFGRTGFAAAVAAYACGVASAAAQSRSAPLNYLEAFGQKSKATLPLLQGLGAISIAVVVVIALLLLLAPFRGRRADGDDPHAIHRTGPGLGWIYIGTAISTVVLFASTIWTMIVMADVRHPPETPAVTVEITGHQWWWEARYLDQNPSRILQTANEIHIPVGKPVMVHLKSADVIHSFWVPALSGKTDAIPGQTNVLWIEASRPGRYRGQCSEFCGAQHAHMGFYIVADEPNRYSDWYDHQLEGASASSADVRQGKAVFDGHCGICHAVRGTTAGGIVGPNLSHIMSRSTLAAATLPNTAGDLSAWIADPQHPKPGSKMPRLGLSGPELNAVRTYLATLD